LCPRHIAARQPEPTADASEATSCATRTCARSMRASIAGANDVGLAAPFVEGDDWKLVLSAFGADWPDRVRTIGPIPRLRKAPGGWTDG
jgi:hypothetical protein